MLKLIYFLTAIFSSIVAALAGFGIGSFLTPLLSLQLSTKTAVTLVAIPHLLATTLRFGILRKDLDIRIFIRFGLTSILGGLLGAWAHSFLDAQWLSFVLGALLILAGCLGISEKSLRLRGFGTWMGGIFSGFFGGLVGNQGGIRAAALLGLDMRKETFVAVSTASALLVDLARLPFYINASHKEIAENLPTILILCVGVITGTWLGIKLFRKVPDARFKKIISYCLIALGLFMIAKGFIPSNAIFS